MTVAELIAELNRWPSDAVVHLDVSEPYEGDRVVRTVSGVRHQSGFNAVAIDADSADESNRNYGEETDRDLIPLR